MQLTTLRTLIHEHPQLRPYVINGLVRRAECASVIGGTKTAKSWLIGDLALSIASGRPWLEKWEVNRGRVLLIDAELHGETLANRLPQIAAARRIPMCEVGDSLYVETIRGRGLDVFKLERMIENIEKDFFTAIILDPLYRCWPADQRFDENSNSDVCRAFNAIDKYAEMTGAMWACCHHATKGAQNMKAVADVGAGAGSFARATDTHIVLRPHQEPGAVVMSVVLRSWPPVPDTCYRWSFPVWKPADDLDPSKLLDPLRPWLGKERPRKPKLIKKTPNEILEIIRDKVMTVAGKRYTSQDVCFLAKEFHLSDKQAYRALHILADRGEIKYTPGKGRAPAVVWKPKKRESPPGEQPHQ